MVALRGRQNEKTLPVPEQSLKITKTKTELLSSAADWLQII
jgi:hypothetical protein